MQAEQTEAELRAALEIPPDAKQVLVFGETSHWDPNWLLTSEEYFERRIEPIFEEVIDALEQEPRRVFCIECLFFFQLYWERHPARRPELRRLVNGGRLRLTGSGITTPDTLLPSTEAILRDYLLGQEWLRDNGMTPEPRLAYLPDDFGHSPALPSLLDALGFDRAGITRIDGMYFVGADLRPPWSFPLEGSSADLLGRELRTQDFVWRAPDGAEVLCHWNAFTYFQGDMLAHIGVIRWMGMTLGVPWRTGRHVARRVDALVRQLAPLSRTPYLFCPIGCDFNGPIRDLVGLLDRYNRERYGDTGVWVVNAGMDDHLALVDFHRSALPVVELDPNPYWMGFYATRPNVKRRCNRVARKLVLAEKLVFDGSPQPEVHAEEMASAWNLVAISNHHDFITGTTPERVYQREQLPWLQEAEALADRCVARACEGARALPLDPPQRAPRWRLADGTLDVTTQVYRLRMTERQGGCIVSLRTRDDDAERLAGPANDLVVYRDSGGLWRMGHEFLGGTFREAHRASDQPAQISAEERDGCLVVSVRSYLGAQRVLRRLWIEDASPVLRLHLEGEAAEGTTVTCRFPTVSHAETLTMNVPGGVVERPRKKLFDPTFWAARSFAFLSDPDDWGLAVFLGGPACVSMPAPGAMEWVALRHAPLERAFGFLPLPAHPASGVGTSEGGFDYAVWLTPDGDFRGHHLLERGRRALRETLYPEDGADLDAAASAALLCDREDVVVTAIKPASRGDGYVVRLRSDVGPDARWTTRLSCPSRPIAAATLCDARERDREPLPMDGDAAVVTVTRAITTVRLRFGDV